jgi:hypothetical protein
VPCAFTPRTTQLQRLELVKCSIAGGPAGAAQLLSHLQALQQLTYLDVNNLDLTGRLDSDSASPPAAAYSSLTASSKLLHLDISWGVLPAGAWQHMFPAGKQLPHLRTLIISHVKLAVKG